MPMRSEMIHQIYIADGFDDDCDLLVHRCVQAERLNYETFCEIWKDMQFDSLYVGRTSPVEIAELTEEMVHIAKQYLLAQTNNFEETVAGLFLVYGLLNLQPYQGFAVLRLVPEDAPKIKRIEEIARRERRHDVLYILGTVLIKHTQYQAEQRERGIEQVYRKYLEDFISIDRSGYRPRGVFYRQTEELDVIRELAAVTDRYETAKKAVTGGKPDPSLSYINKSLPTELDASLKRIISGMTAVADDDEIDAADVHYSKVQAIKDKAMKNAVGGIRHLTSAAERKRDKSQQIVSEIKSKPGKIKTSSPTKPYMSPKKKDTYKYPPKSPRKSTTVPKSKSPKKTSPKLVAKASTSKPIKRKITPKRRKPKKTKIQISSSSDSDSDIDLSDLDKDSESDYNISLSSEDDLDLNNFNQPELSKDVVEIEIDDILPHISTDDVEVIDPEIIDKLNKLKAKIASLEEEVSNSSSNKNKKKGKVISQDVNGNSEDINGLDKEASSSHMNQKETEDSEEESEDSNDSEDDIKVLKRRKKVKLVKGHCFRRLNKIGVFPESNFPEGRRVTRQNARSEGDENSECVATSTFATRINKKTGL